MKTLLLIFFVTISSNIVLAQTPDKTQQKAKETESGQVKTDTAHSHAITGSSYGKSANSSVLIEDSLKKDESPDSVIIDQPIPKGQ